MDNKTAKILFLFAILFCFSVFADKYGAKIEGPCYVLSGSVTKYKVVHHRWQLVPVEPILHRRVPHRQPFHRRLIGLRTEYGKLQSANQQSRLNSEL